MHKCEKRKEVGNLYSMHVQSIKGKEIEKGTEEGNQDKERKS